MVIGFLLLAVIAWWVYRDATARGADQAGLWAIGTFLLAILVLPAWLLTRPPKGGATRKCPHCAEDIKVDAKLCRFCGTAVEPLAAASGPEQAPATGRTSGATWVVAGIALLAVLAIIGTMMSSTSPGTGTSQASSLSRAVLGPSGVTMAQFNRLRDGMSYREAVEVLGAEGTELSRSNIADIVTVMYTWTGSGGFGANMNAMFQDDRLVTKAQLGLQ